MEDQKRPGLLIVSLAYVSNDCRRQYYNARSRLPLASSDSDDEEKEVDPVWLRTRVTRVSRH